jgi:lipopolysaccharide/colanic/teichoic acid biosynthesis glycosyltransferase
VIGAVLLFLLSPVVVGLWLLVRWRNGANAIFRQQRVGLNGQQFEMLKFRTMLPDRRAGEVSYQGTDRRQTHKSDADPRHTEIGRRLRRWSLDELPQLWNVVNGEMSLIGPRPELTGVVQTYAPWQHSRHLVKPGITGLWQVSARGSGRMMQDCTDIDLAYIREVSLATDLKIIARTFRAASSGR